MGIFDWMFPKGTKPTKPSKPSLCSKKVSKEEENVQVEEQNTEEKTEK